MEIFFNEIWSNWYQFLRETKSSLTLFDLEKLLSGFTIIKEFKSLIWKLSSETWNMNDRWLNILGLMRSIKKHWCVCLERTKGKSYMLWFGNIAIFNWEILPFWFMEIKGFQRFSLKVFFKDTVKYEPWKTQASL